MAERAVKQIVPVSGWVYVTYGYEDSEPVVYANDVAALAWVETTAEYGREDRFLLLIREPDGGEWRIPPDEPSDLVPREHFEQHVPTFRARAKRLSDVNRKEPNT